MKGQDHARTLSIVHALMEGKRLELPHCTIAMAEDMSIGFVIKRPDGEYIVEDLGLGALNKMLDKCEVGHAIPEVN